MAQRSIAAWRGSYDRSFCDDSPKQTVSDVSIPMRRARRSFTENLTVLRRRISRREMSCHNGETAIRKFSNRFLCPMSTANAKRTLMPKTHPQFPLQLIPEEHMSEAEDRAIRQLLCTCFPADAVAFAQNRAWHDSVPAFSVVCREADAVTGHVAIVVRTIRCGDQPVTVAGVQNMCVTPDRRGTGLAQSLLSRAFEDCSRQKCQDSLPGTGPPGASHN